MMQETTPLGFIRLDVVWLGYCNNCGRADTVGVFSIRGWKHRFSICRFCLNLIRELLDTGELWISRRLTTYNTDTNPVAWGDEVEKWVRGNRTVADSTVKVVEPALEQTSDSTR